MDRIERLAELSKPPIVCELNSNMGLCKTSSLVLTRQVNKLDCQRRLTLFIIGPPHTTPDL